ncbi:hypothetical protein QUC31_002897 [Theobroma cacao]
MTRKAKTTFLRPTVIDRQSTKTRNSCCLSMTNDACNVSTLTKNNYLISGLFVLGIAHKNRQSLGVSGIRSHPTSELFASLLLIPQTASMFSPSETSNTVSKVFSLCASLAGFIMLLWPMAQELISDQVRSYLSSNLPHFFSHISPIVTVEIDEKCGVTKNEVYEAATLYVSTKVSTEKMRHKVNKTREQKYFTIAVAKGEPVVDQYDGVKLTWRLVCKKDEFGEERLFKLSFNKKHHAKVLTSYLPYVWDEANMIRTRNRMIKLYSRQCPFSDDNDDRRGSWGSIILEHPATFETLAMDPDLKKMIMDDLERFVRRKEYYNKVGKAWKRGYLLFGPSGTGKSSLVAAMANYLKFDIYDFALNSVSSDVELRKMLLSTSNRSIVLFEDIDCSSEVLGRQIGMQNEQEPPKFGQLTLSGILNCIDGVCSSCRDERIIVFTTRYKDRLDPALLRPGRMDMHINMSYCTTYGFKLLAFNHLGISNEHIPFLGEIDGLLKSTETTPAEVAEELMRYDDADVALQGLVDFLKRKRDEGNET